MKKQNNLRRRQERYKNFNYSELFIYLILLIFLFSAFVYFVDQKGIVLLQVPPSQNVVLTWNDNSINEQGFYIERRITGSGALFGQIANLLASQYPSGMLGTTISTGFQVTYVDSTVVAGTTYDYQVKAYNSAGTSDPSNIISIQIPTQTLCGNGIIEAPETCDDGNGVSGDGCSNSCQIETGTGWNCANNPAPPPASICFQTPQITNINPGSQSNPLLNTQTNFPTITGTNFASGAQVILSSTGLGGSFTLSISSITSTQINFILPTFCPECGVGGFSIQVDNAPGISGGESNVMPVYLTSPSPSITIASPLTMVSTLSAFSITGTNFLPKGTILLPNNPAVPYFAGSYVKIIYTPAGSIIPGSPIYFYQHNGLILNAQGDLVIPIGSLPFLAPGTYSISVLNPNQAGTSNPLTDPSSTAVSLSVTPPPVCVVAGNTPTLTDISPGTSSPVLNRGTQTLTITGTNLLAGATLNIPGTPYTFPLNVISPTQSTINNLVIEGFPPNSYFVLVTNWIGLGTPEPCTSNVVTWVVSEDTPVITDFIPSTISTAGGTFTINGNGFYLPNNYGTLSNVGLISGNGFASLNGIINYNVVSSTQIDVIVLAYNANNYNIGVMNPGGSVSNSNPLNIVTPITPAPPPPPPAPPGGGSGGSSGGGGGSPQQPQCNNNRDDDNDGECDFDGAAAGVNGCSGQPDLGCSSATDTTENSDGTGLGGPFAGLSECEDGIDNDGDGNEDFPADPDCDTPYDDTEGSEGGPSITIGQGEEELSTDAVLSRIVFWSVASILIAGIVAASILILVQLRRFLNR